MPSAHLPLPASAGFAVAVLVGGVAVLGGCESEAAPPASSSATRTTSGSPSPSLSPSPSPSPSVEIPAAAREKSDEGAEAFVRYFFDQVNLAWTRPSAELIPKHSDAGCKSCESLQSTAEKLQTNDQRYARSPVSVRGARSVPGAPAGQQFVEVDLLQHRVDIVDDGGAVVGTDKNEKFTRTVALRWKDGRWFVYDMA